MSETIRIIQLFRERTSKELLVASSLTLFQEEELVNQLFEVFESVCTSTSYNEEAETTLDDNTSDNKIDECEKMLMNYLMIKIMNKKRKRNKVFESFSLSCMTRALPYYDAINPKTGKRSHMWKSGQNKFERVTHQ